MSEWRVIRAATNATAANGERRSFFAVYHGLVEEIAQYRGEIIARLELALVRKMLDERALWGHTIGAFSIGEDPWGPMPPDDDVN